MNRLIRSFASLTDEIKDLLVQQYPNGVEDYHIKSVNTTTGDILKVIEIKTAETIYMIKFNMADREEIEEYIEEESSDDDELVDVDGDDLEDDEDL